MDVCYCCLYHFNAVPYEGGLLGGDGVSGVGKTVETVAEKPASAIAETAAEKPVGATVETVAGETASVSPAEVLSDVALVPFLQKQGKSQVYKIRFSLSDDERKSSQAFVGMLTFSRESFDML